MKPLLLAGAFVLTASVAAFAAPSSQTKCSATSSQLIAGGAATLTEVVANTYGGGKACKSAFVPVTAAPSSGKLLEAASAVPAM